MSKLVVVVTLHAKTKIKLISGCLNDMFKDGNNDILKGNERKGWVTLKAVALHVWF